jgi:hypothetical protein
MRAQRKRFVAAGLLSAILAAAGSLHHEDLSRFAVSTGNPEAGRVVSSHSPLSKSSHWHSVIRVHEHSCLACHLHRFAALPGDTHEAAPAHTDQFVSHATPRLAAQVFRLSGPTRGPPSHS